MVATYNNIATATNLTKLIRKNIYNLYRYYKGHCCCYYEYLFNSPNTMEAKY